MKITLVHIPFIERIQSVPEKKLYPFSTADEVEGIAPADVEGTGANEVD